MKITPCCAVIAVLLVTGVHLGPVSASNGTSCPTWFYLHNNYSHQCWCGQGLDCSSGKVIIRDGICATSSGQEEQYYFGVCVFGHPVNRTDRMHAEMPSDPDMLDEVMCGPYNRKGLLCGECIDGYGPAVYSFDMKCADCSKLSPGYAISLYLVIELLPITLFFICLVVFRFNITSGPLLGYVLFSQFYTVELNQNLYIYEYITSHVSESLRVLFKLSLALSQFWSLQYMKTVIPPFCISEKLTNIHIQLLNFVPATYPLILVIITCVLMELHARNCRIIHILWKPFSIILNKTNLTAVTSDAVIHAFASVIFLSNFNVLTAEFSLQYLSEVKTNNNTFHKRVLLYQPNMEKFGHEHILYTSLSAVPLIMVTIIPSVILTIYPTRLYTCLSRCLSARKRLAITAFAEALNSHLKDGLNGTRDYRWLAGCSLFGMLLYEIIRNGLQHLLFFESPLFTQLMIFMLSFLLISYTQPCKQTVANISLSFHFLLVIFFIFLYYEWLQDLTSETDMLELIFIIIPLTSHALVLIWVSFTVTCHIKKCLTN